MQVTICANAEEMALAAARLAGGLIRDAIAERGAARVVVATGSSQLAFLKRLIADEGGEWGGDGGIDWQKVEMFHLDEYIGLSGDHPASFQRYVRERIAEPAGVRRVHYLDGTGDPEEVCRVVGEALAGAPVDVAFVGLGENGHLAFNEPPADFETEAPYLIVTLDERTRRQQVGEGWFASLEEVPRRAITMSIRQILKARAIVCLAPEARKAEAVRLCFGGEVSVWAPASALQGHANATVLLDKESAAGLPTG
jgi:glucosamine-6-phosphate deaminase